MLGSKVLIVIVAFFVSPNGLASTAITGYQCFIRRRYRHSVQPGIEHSKTGYVQPILGSIAVCNPLLKNFKGKFTFSEVFADDWPEK
jgi:hypothetical protein